MQKTFWRLTSATLLLTVMGMRPLSHQLSHLWQTSAQQVARHAAHPSETLYRFAQAGR